VRELLLAGLGVVVFLLPASASGRPAQPTVGTVTPIMYGTQGANGWYVTNVTVNWVVQPLGYLTTEGCDARTIATDTVNTDLTCTATWSDGTVSSTIHIHRDATPPTVAVTPERAPDANGWYNHAVAFAYTGADPTSGVAACSRVTFAGPDNPSASVTGTCSDNAGNITSVSTALKYDATPPTVTSFRVAPGNRKAKLDWNVRDASSIQVVRTPGLKGAAQSVVFSGQGSTKGFTDRKLYPGRQYQYSLTATDVAANQTAKALAFLARNALLFPAPSAQVAKAPLLVWAPKRGASYYNVILTRGRRVFSAWPVKARLQLPRAWKYRGRSYKLRPGTYSWFVWPGYGSLSAGRYGKMLGGSTFKFGGSG
jgi:hypothetical protein